MPKDEQPKTAKASKADKAPSTRKLSAYNVFMKANLSKVRAANPNMNHRDAFKAVAELWAKAPENPNNKK